MNTGRQWVSFDKLTFAYVTVSMFWIGFASCLLVNHFFPGVLR